MHPLEADELLLRMLDAGARRRDVAGVDLRDLVAGDRASVGHLEPDRHVRIAGTACRRWGDSEPGVAKRRVRQPIPEGVDGIAVVVLVSALTLDDVVVRDRRKRGEPGV